MVLVWPTSMASICGPLRGLPLSPYDVSLLQDVDNAQFASYQHNPDNAIRERCQAEDIHSRRNRVERSIDTAEGIARYKFGRRVVVSSAM
ncbi:hypothetical protein BJX65DRAFT_49391 [Aspergillus insuetus]